GVEFVAVGVALVAGHPLLGLGPAGVVGGEDPLPDEGAPPGDAGDAALVGQRGQGEPDGVAGHAVGGADLLLGRQPRAWWQPTGVDLLPQVRCDAVIQSSGLSHLAEPPTLYQQMVRTLLPGRRAEVMIPTVPNVGTNPT